MCYFILGIILDDASKSFEVISIPLSTEQFEDDESENLNCFETSEETPNEMNLEMNEEDESEIIEDLESYGKLFENIKTTDITDATDTQSINQHDGVLKLKIKSKLKLVKKSTLCWVFGQKNGRVSTDRIFRFRGKPGNKVGKRKTIEKKKYKNQKKT